MSPGNETAAPVETAVALELVPEEFQADSNFSTTEAGIGDV